MRHKISLPYYLRKKHLSINKKKEKGNPLKERRNRKYSLELPSSWSRSKTLAGILLFASTAAKAASLHTLDEMQTISLPISGEGLTRIAVQGDRISSVYGTQGEYTLEADEDLGQIFLRPTLASNRSSISLTLTTEKGLSQDLRLILKNKDPEAIILKKEEEPFLKKKSSMDSSSVSPPSAAITRTEVIELLGALKEGLIPFGYQSLAVEFNKKEWPYLLLKDVRNEKLQGLVLEVENRSTLVLPLKASAFGSHSKTIAVALKTQSLQHLEEILDCSQEKKDSPYFGDFEDLPHY